MRIHLIFVIGTNSMLIKEPILPTISQVLKSIEHIYPSHKCSFEII